MFPLKLWHKWVRWDHHLHVTIRWKCLHQPKNRQKFMKHRYVYQRKDVFEYECVSVPPLVDTMYNMCVPIKLIHVVAAVVLCTEIHMRLMFYIVDITCKMLLIGDGLLVLSHNFKSKIRLITVDYQYLFCWCIWKKGPRVYFFGWI
jgi:hypothetical protein